MTDNELKNIVAFCALMENNDGIIGKSPDYIEEKFKHYCALVGYDTEDFRFGLDSVRQRIVREWEEKWLKK